MALSPKREEFARQYVALGGSGKAAALAAGYSEARAKQTASELIRRPDVAARIEELSKEHADELGVDARWLLSEYLEYARLARLGKFKPEVGLRALDSIGKLIGANAPTRHEVETRTVSVKMNLAPVPDAEMAEVVPIS